MPDVTLDDLQADPWRRACPNGDRNPQLRQPNGGAETRVYCTSCLRRGDDPRHDRVIDAKTGDEIQL
jgi:hypothetical protein